MLAVIGDRYGTSEVLRVGQVAKPVPGPGEALVRVQASSVNTADIDHLRGRPWIVRLVFGLRRPRQPVRGLDMVGVVEAVGSAVTSVTTGSTVWADLFSAGSGAFAEYVCVPAEALHPLPAGLPSEMAATLPHSAALALQALDSRRIRAGDSVLVNGGGGCVGPFAIQIARSRGAEVTGVDHSGKLDLMSSAGADHVVDYTRDDVTRLGRRYDLVVDIAATRSVLAFRRCLTRDGAYVQIARTLGGFVSAALLGAVFGGRRRMGVFSWTPNRRVDMSRLAELVISGDVVPVVDRVFPLVETPQAVAHVETGRARGKVVIAT